MQAFLRKGRPQLSFIGKPSLVSCPFPMLENNPFPIHENFYGIIGSILIFKSCPEIGLIIFCRYLRTING